MDTFIFIVNLIGTVAFAASGAMIGLKKNMDLFGVCTLGLTTAVGGGVIRDLILGLTPPAAFQDPTAALVALATSGVFFLRRVRRVLMQDQHRYDELLFWMDAWGLGAFTVMGVQRAYDLTWNTNPFLLVFVGVLTGVGGGILRDLMAQEVPDVFKRNIYACASLAGALLCTLFLPVIDGMSALIFGLALVVLIRFLAHHYDWNLPRAKF